MDDQKKSNDETKFQGKNLAEYKEMASFWPTSQTSQSWPTQK